MATTSDVIVTFPGGKRVDAEIGGHVIHTDQPQSVGGEDSAPSPFLVFLASVASCAGFYVINFCQRRGIPTEGLKIVQHAENDPETGTLKNVEIRIETPPGFPTQYNDAILGVVERCAVKKAIQAQPQITTRIEPATGSGPANQAA